MRAELTHEAVSGAAVNQVELRGPTGKPGAPATGWAPSAWSALGSAKTPGLYTVRFTVSGDAVAIPHCNGRGRIRIDGTARETASKGPVVLHLDAGTSAAHAVEVDVTVSTYEKRIACSEAPRAGAVVRSTEGLHLLKFASPSSAKGGGEAVVFVPGGHDPKVPAVLLVGTHPWNGSPWTYAAYAELLEQAGAKDVVLVMPSGLGNSLYVAEAEDEVMRAIDAVAGEIAIDPRRVSIWGASMGGAGATTIAFHRPDRFAFVASYFGDSKYDLTTYVKGILGGEAGARKVNALDVIENARYLPVWLVHGEADRTSPIEQSTMLHAAMTRAGFDVTFDRVPGMGHEGPLVARYVRRVVDRAATSRSPAFPARVTFRSVRASDTRAYGVAIVRSGSGNGDAFVDIERIGGAIVVHRAEGIRGIVLEPGALGAQPGDPIDTRGAPGVDVRRGP